MTVRYRTIIAIPSFVLAACAVTPQTRTSQQSQPQCALAIFPENDRIGGWSVDKFTGRFSRGSDTLTVRRDQHRFLIEGWTLGTRELTAESVESWTWLDGCGVRYEFVLPPDGPGGWLKLIMSDGTTTDWHR